MYLYLKQLPIYIARKHDFNKTISKVVLSYWEKADWQRKNIVCNEGIEKKVPEHKDSMKKKNFPTRNHPPPQSKVKWSAPNDLDPNSNEFPNRLVQGRCKSVNWGRGEKGVYSYIQILCN